MQNFINLLGQKNIVLSIRPFFLKTDAPGRAFIFIQAKNGCGNFFFLKLVTIFFKSCASKPCMVFSSDIIQVRP